MLLIWFCGFESHYPLKLNYQKMTTKMKYKPADLDKMSIIQLTEIAATDQINIQNSFRQGLISDILSKQQSRSQKPSELHSRFRYATVAKFIAILIMSMTIYSCATQAPRSASLHHAVSLRQEAAQYQARLSAGKDPGRMYRNWDRRPKRMTRIPFTQFYIF